MSDHDTHAHDSGPEVRDVSRIQGLFPALLGLGIVALGIAVAIGRGDARQLGLAYLTGYTSFLTISLGALFFVAIQHLTRAGWSVTIRRLAEVMAANMVTLIVLALPILFGVGTIYSHWVHPHGETAYLVEEKAAWLNVPFWTARILFYLLVWTGLAWWLWRNSLKQDRTGEVAITEKLQAKAGLAIVIFALSANFGLIDLLMTLDPLWYSTMFGVYGFAGGFLNFNAAMILLLRFLQSRGIVTRSVTREHYHDLGKFMFAFVFFWSYVAYSQWMLIWYGNIPEETAWFAKRGATTSSLWAAGQWGKVAIFLVACHSFIPFAGLMSRWPKRALGALTFWAMWMSVMHLVDMFWLIMPEHQPEAVETYNVGRAFLLAALCWVGVGSIWLAGIIKLASAGSLVPQHDPRLPEALAHEVY